MTLDIILPWLQVLRIVQEFIFVVDFKSVVAAFLNYVLLQLNDVSCSYLYYNVNSNIMIVKKYDTYQEA